MCLKCLSTAISKQRYQQQEAQQFILQIFMLCQLIDNLKIFFFLLLTRRQWNHISQLVAATCLLADIVNQFGIWHF